MLQPEINPGETHVHAWAASVRDLSRASHLPTDEGQKLVAHLQSADNIKVLEPLILIEKCRKCFDPKCARLTLRARTRVEDSLRLSS